MSDNNYHQYGKMTLIEAIYLIVENENQISMSNYKYYLDQAILEKDGYHLYQLFKILYSDKTFDDSKYNTELINRLKNEFRNNHDIYNVLSRDRQYSYEVLVEWKYYCKTFSKEILKHYHNAPAEEILTFLIINGFIPDYIKLLNSHPYNGINRTDYFEVIRMAYEANEFYLCREIVIQIIKNNDLAKLIDYFNKASYFNGAMTVTEILDKFNIPEDYRLGVII